MIHRGLHRPDADPSRNSCQSPVQPVDAIVIIPSERRYDPLNRPILSDMSDKLAKIMKY